MFSAVDVKNLREKTGAGMLDCKKALEASNGNMDQAVDWLREKGISKASKKEARIAAVSYESVNEIIADVKSGKLQAAIIEDSVVLNYLETEFEAFVVEDENASGSAFAFPKDSELTEEFNGKIKEYKTNDELE